MKNYMDDFNVKAQTEDTSAKAASPLLGSMPFSAVKDLTRLVENGKVDEIGQLFESYKQSGKLSEVDKESLQRIKYSVAIMVGIACKAAISCGVYETDALNIANKALNSVDTLNSTYEIVECGVDCVKGFAQLVATSNIKNVESPIIIKITNYIHDHLTERITSSDLAKVANCSEQYLARLFKSELNTNLSKFVLQQKINEALYLIDSDVMPCNEVGPYLGFCSQSHFIQCFKKVTGYTPYKYRNMRYERRCIARNQ